MVVVTCFPMLGYTYTTRYGRYPHMPLFISYKDLKIYNARDVCFSMGEMIGALGIDNMKGITW